MEKRRKIIIALFLVSLLVNYLLFILFYFFVQDKIIYTLIFATIHFFVMITLMLLAFLEKKTKLCRYCIHYSKYVDEYCNAEGQPIQLKYVNTKNCKNYIGDLQKL